MTNQSLYQIEQELYDVLSEIEQNEGELTPELEARLELTKDKLDTKLDNYCKFRASLLSRIKGLNEEIERMKNLINKEKRMIEFLENRLLNAVIQFGQEHKGVYRFKTPLFNLSTRRHKSYEYNEEMLIDKFYIEHRTLDKQAIRDRIKAGEVIEGVTEIEKISLTIK